MSRKVNINGKEYQMYDGKGLPADGDVAILVVPLKRQEQSYFIKDAEGNRTNEKAVVVKYADSGFGSRPAPTWDGTLIYNLEIKEAKNKASVATEVVAI